MANDIPAEFLPDFEGFGAKAFAFFDGLEANNERAWFQHHKEQYETEVKFPMECLVASFGSDRPENKGLAVRGDPKGSLFRIHRDVRFSKDKRPYKTHIGAILSRSGGRKENGIVYIHIAPDRCFIGAGFYRPDTPLLNKWRQKIVDDPEEFEDVVETVTASPGRGKKGHYMRSVDELQTMPRGFKEHADAPYADYLRWKSFLVMRDVTRKEAGGKGFVGIVRDFARQSEPLLRYGWALADEAPDDDPRPHRRTR